MIGLSNTKFPLVNLTALLMAALNLWILQFSVIEVV